MSVKHAAEQFELLEVEEDLLLPDSRVRHAFTGEQLERRKQLKQAIMLLLAAGVPIDTIAQRVGVSEHTVTGLRDRAFESVADQKKTFGQVLLGKGAKFLGLAEAKASDATFKDLMIAAGIATQRGMELQAMDSGAGSSQPKAIDVDGARARVLARIEAARRLDPTPTVDPESIDVEPIDGRCEQVQADGSTGGAAGGAAGLGGSETPGGGSVVSPGGSDTDVWGCAEVSTKGGDDA